ncbi:MAG: hypothetical protein ING89_04255 [Rubrivivax sp.]|nr:hypothetical protein [Rubrivivax sp.]
MDLRQRMRTASAWTACLALGATLVACGGGSGDAAPATPVAPVSPVVPVPPAPPVAPAAPVITAQPQPQSVSDGGAATFSVTASGTGLGYQWQRNGVPVAGATGPTLSLTGLTLGDTGARWRVVVSNAGGTAVSDEVALAVTPVAPTIASAPLAATATAGQTATFTVVASGSAPLGYQWLREGAAIGGATSPSFTTAALALTDDGARFAVRVTNAAGSVTSTTATLTVVAAPVGPQIAAQPQSVSAVVGATATFRVVATGTAPLSYQWRRNGGDITGAVSDSYTTPALGTTDAGAVYSVRISNAVGSIVSAGAVLTVTAAEPVSVLAGRAWRPVVQVAQNLVGVLTPPFVGMADDGRAVVVAEVRPLPPVVPGRTNFVVVLGEPGGTGAERWTSPQTLASFGTRSGAAVPTDLRVDALRVAPSGRAVILASGSEGGCPRNTFGGIQVCRFVTVLDPATSTWSPWDVMALLSESPSSDFTLFGDSTLTLNDRGDLALSFAPLPGEPVARVFWRAGGEVGFRSMLMRGTPTEPARRGRVTLDESGGLVFAAELLQGGTTDIAVWRGSVAAGLSGPVVVDTRAARATLRALHTGRSGRSYLFWQQNNGVADSLYALRFESVSTVLDAEDLGPTLAQAFPPNNQLLEASVRDDDVLIASRGGVPNNNCATARWPFSGSLAFIDAPAPCLGSVSGLSPPQFGRERGGNRLVMGNESTWATYDADLNRQIHAPVDTRAVLSGPGYVTGVQGPTINFGLVQLSRSGVGLAVFGAAFDVWPTPSMPAGDGRPSVSNLWVTYFK